MCVIRCAGLHCYSILQYYSVYTVILSCTAMHMVLVCVTLLCCVTLCYTFHCLHQLFVCRRKRSCALSLLSLKTLFWFTLTGEAITELSSLSFQGTLQLSFPLISHPSDSVPISTCSLLSACLPHSSYHLPTPFSSPSVTLLLSFLFSLSSPSR